MVVAAAVASVLMALPLGADETDKSKDQKTSDAKPDGKTDKKSDEKPKDPPGLTRLDPRYNVWIDAKNKWVVMDAVVTLREGPPIEMFACLVGTKEYESVVAVKTEAKIVHAALLAVGAKVGTAVQFPDPERKLEYKPATGTEIDVWVLWTDKKGKRHKVRAQEMVRDIKTQKAMTHPWVFAGSGFWVDERTGKAFYLAEGGGELICVSNFPSAMMDLPVESTQVNEGLLFEAFTENIPELGAQVRLVLAPKLKK